MAEGEARSPRPFDVRTVHYLVRLMTKNDLSEIDLQEGDQRVRLRRGPRGIVATTTPMVAAASAPMLAPAAPQLAAATAAAPVAEKKAPEAKPGLEIKSPTPGTFYAAPNPDSPPFVQVGTKVKPDTVVCTIEAMKVFNEIQAECTGTIVAVLVENQQPVEYGQVLFRVEPG